MAEFHKEWWHLVNQGRTRTNKNISDPNSKQLLLFQSWVGLSPTSPLCAEQSQKLGFHKPRSPPFHFVALQVNAQRAVISKSWASWAGGCLLRAAERASEA